ncbi:MAG TPA: class I SAM-dependent methyltransferase [Anaerolineae bacterium]|nr:class I SAM-dependent methyltransferase [Anaerolineae bacterium]
MSRPESAFGFNTMSLWFKLRDLLAPLESTLSEVGIESGFHLLDYGCGPGSYSIAAAELVGQSGKVYAADMNALALRRVRSSALKKGLRNIETVHTDCETGLENGTIDVVLLYDTYHDLMEPDRVLEELHRVLKAGAILSFSDHHMNDGEILEKLASQGFFEFGRRGKKTFTFARTG